MRMPSTLPRLALALLVSSCGAPIPAVDASSDAARSDAPADDAGVSDAASVDAGEPVDAVVALDAGPPLPPPPETWREHWFEHDQLLVRVDYNDDVALYFDPDVPREGTEWLMPYLTRLWRYTVETYGDFGGDRLYSIHHQGRYSGGHPSTYFDESHDFRNVSDVGPGPWLGGYDIAAHEVSHIVEGASRGVHGSPAFGIWGDSKWAEIFLFDAFTALGMTEEADRVYASFMATSDDFPRPGTHWFRDWFYPLWRDHGHARVMVELFRLLSEHFPRSGRDYARGMNWGEFVHFMSGAAGADLTEMANRAFGVSAERDAQLAAARRDFPAITY